MFFHSTPRYGYRKNKAVRTLCGAVLGLALAASTGADVAAQTDENQMAEPLTTVAASAEAQASTDLSSDDSQVADQAETTATTAVAPAHEELTLTTSTSQTETTASLASQPTLESQLASSTSMAAAATSSVTTDSTLASSATSSPATSLLVEATSEAGEQEVIASTTTTALADSQVADNLATSTSQSAAPLLATSTSQAETSQTAATTAASTQTADQASVATEATAAETSSLASASASAAQSQTLTATSSTPAKQALTSSLKPETEQTENTALAQTLKKVENTTDDATERTATNTGTQTDKIKPTTYVAPATEVKQNGKFLTIQRHADIPSMTEVFYAVWTENKGQDDLRFHQADKKGALTLDLSKVHQEYGRYHIHTYYKNTKTGSFNIQHALQMDVKRPQLDIKVTKVADGQYAVNISGITNDIDSISVPTWSDRKGQDDIIWKSAIKSGTTSYTTKLNIADHQFDTGKYHIHVYGQSNITKKQVGLIASSTIVENRQVTSTITSKSPGIFTVTLDQVPSYFDKILLPVWSDQGGQDDIVWHETTKKGKTSYTADIKISDHQFDTGKYHVHAYGITNTGRMIGLQATSHNVEKPKITTSVATKSKDSFTVTVEDVPEYFTGLYTPTWTNHKGQDDIIWHSAKKAGKTTYTADIKIADHKYETGQYIVHFYGIGPKGKLHGLGGLSHQVANLASKAVTSLTHVNSQAGTFTVNISETEDSKAIQSIQLDVWSDKDKGNLHTYRLNPTKDKSQIQVNAANHGYKNGDYQTKAIITYKDGSQTVIQPNQANLTTTTLAPVYEKPSLTATIANNDTVNGTFDVVLSNIVAPKGIKAIHVPVWGEKDGQNDIVWYQATKQADNTYKVNIDAKNHHKERGTYHAHIYITEGDEVQSIVAAQQNVVGFRQNKLKQIIYLDPGHGGYDPGAISPDGRVYEKTLNLEVAYRVKNKLENQGYQVLMTRYDDRYVDFVTERSRMANYSIADLFVSIHFNASAFGPNSISGIETYWYGYNPAYQPIINPVMHNNPDRLTKSESLAHLIHNNLIKHTGAVNQGVKRETFTVLRETGIPAVLLELGYIDNASDLAKITTAAYQEKLSQAIVEGLLAYYKLYN